MRDWCLSGRNFEWYSINKQASMLDNLTHEMIRCDGGQKKSKLKAKEAEARYLYKFDLHLATSFYEQISGDEFLITALFRKLVRVQDLVSGDAVDYDPQKGSTACRRLCTLYKTLRDASEFPFWQLKPKLSALEAYGVSVACVWKPWIVLVLSGRVLVRLGKGVQGDAAAQTTQILRPRISFFRAPVPQPYLRPCSKSIR